MSSDKLPRVALLIDSINLGAYTIRGVLAEITKHGDARVRRMYGDWTQPDHVLWKKFLEEHSILPVQQFAYTTDKATDKKATDGAMTIDAMDLLHTGHFDAFYLVSNDSDFSRLALRIREQGLAVYGFGDAKTPRPFINAYDKFYYIHAFEASQSLGETPHPASSHANVGISPTTAPASSGAATGRLDAQALSILREAVEACAGDDGQANLSNVGNYLSPEFKAANYGFGTLRQLAKASGILDVEFVGRPPAAAVCMVRLRDTTHKRPRVD
ncbi:hypothetical protein KVR01_000102 [Diaporthe batatas]|uniref:uncharacterized protein n=1 Tax=Diaporthe batatas TaxID=748121 RepID=UPI001D04783A|nr:uncharacterized protein KVR01_000102 [Diaporthe batatas]KAG8169357.1 hypothetical protein KVR01_000102 [Diaporthe batatas]